MHVRRHPTLAVAVATVLSLVVIPTGPAAVHRTTARQWIPVDHGPDMLPAPIGGSEQTALMVGDVDGDSDQDLVLGSRKGPNSVLLYRNQPSGWQVETVEPAALPIEAGGTLHDIDGDGDLDVVLGGDHSSNSIWWWSNPGHENGRWDRFSIKSTGSVRHHDLVFGDFDGDGSAELAAWNQGPNSASLDELLVGAVPADPRAGEWPLTVVFDAPAASEGLVVADVDRNGTDDLVSAGRWLRTSAEGWITSPIGPVTSGQVAVGDLIAGGWLEVVVSSGDQIGGLDMFHYVNGVWIATDLLAATDQDAPWRNGHSVQIGDLDLDGHLDVFSAEMALTALPTPRAIALIGDGAGGFTHQPISDGDDHHDSVLADLDGDGDLDVVGKPYNDGTPALLWYRNDATIPIDAINWERHQIGTRAQRSTFVSDGDLDGDGDLDLATSRGWFSNPGSLSGAWTSHLVGAGMEDILLVVDLDGDGDLDLFGTQGRTASANSHRLVWAANDGSGIFEVHTNVTHGRDSFVQGLATRRAPDGSLEIWLSWNDRELGIDRLTVPSNPVTTTWPMHDVTPVSQGEQIEFADIDRDGDLDLLEGHIWLRNDNESWRRHDLHHPTTCCFAGLPVDGDRLPDRVVAVDMNDDGRIDSLVAHEYDLGNSIAWYEQPVDPTNQWTEHVVHQGGPLPIHSLDAADVDRDGDIDVVAAEHDASASGGAAAFLLENLGGATTWRNSAIHVGEDHHDGMQLTDLDGDGDLDVMSIGWVHDAVVVYENQEAATGPQRWWEPGHRYRLDLTVSASGGLPSGAVVGFDVDLGAAVTALGGSGAMRSGSIRVVEVDAFGRRIDGNVPHQFLESVAYDPATFATGELRLQLLGETSNDRRFQAYAETTTSTVPDRVGVELPPPASTAVTTVDGATSRSGRVTAAGAWDGTLPVTVGAFQESGGTVTFEAEQYELASTTSTHRWEPITTRPGFAGASAMAALPDVGASALSSINSAAGLTYRVRFSAPGTYYLWMRGRSPNGAGNSLHSGIDGRTSSTSKLNGFPSNGFGWIGRAPNGERATIMVTNEGVHTIHLWMREDGLAVDRIHLTRSASATPSGIGPPVSVRDGIPPAVTPPAFEEVGGSITIEAESLTTSSSTPSHRWVTTSQPAGYSGSSAMVTTPDTGAVITGSIPTSAPSLTFRVRVASTGTYHVWVRGLAPTPSSNTLHVGLDGRVIASADKLSGFIASGYSWRRSTLDGTNARLRIDTPGVHTVHLWMHRDGLVVDKIHLTTSSTPPTGLGPAQSPSR